MSIGKKSLSLFSRDIVFTLLSLVTGVVITRKLGPVGLGTWAVLDLINNYGRVFGGLRFEISSVYFLGQSKYKKGEVIFLINFVSLICSFFLLIFLANHIAWIKSIFLKTTDIDQRLIFVLLFHFPILFLKRNYHYFLLAQEDTTAFNTMLVIQEIINPIISITLLIFFDFGLWALLIGMLVGSFISMIYGIIKVHSKVRMIFFFNTKLFREMVSFSSKVYFSEGLGFLNIYVSNLTTAALLSPSALAFFSMGKGKAEWLNRITSAVSTILYPRISNLHGANKDPVTVTTDAFRILLLILCFVGILFSLFIYPTVLLLYGAEFLPMVPIFFIVLPSLILFSVANLQRQYFLGIGRTDILLKISIIPLLLQIGLCFLFIPRYSFLGAAYAAALTFLLTAILTIVVYCRLSGASYKNLLIPSKQDFVLIVRLMKEYFVRWFIRLRRLFSNTDNMVAEVETEI